MVTRCGAAAARGTGPAGAWSPSAACDPRRGARAGPRPAARAGRPVAALGEGQDDVAVGVLVVRFSKEPDATARAERVRREARVPLLDIRSDVDPGPVTATLADVLHGVPVADLDGVLGVDDGPLVL